jgi:hypothetical protein
MTCLEPMSGVRSAAVPAAALRTGLRSKMAPGWAHSNALRLGQPRSACHRDRQISILLFVSLLLLHMALARVEKGRPLVVMLHGLATLGAALFYGTDSRHPETTIQAVAYICGAEVLWHMCARSGALPWEFGKYAIVMVMLVAILRRGRVSWLPILYFALLLPSVALTLFQMDVFSAREAVSASLSGPLAIATSFAFMSQVRMTPQQVCRALLCFVVPMTGAAFLCYAGTFGASEVSFGRSSNMAASGGFGPNQVSATLGFGIICALFCLLVEKGRLPLKGLLLVLILWFGVQSGLTFSRTGLYLAGLSAFAGALPLLRNPRARWTVLALAITVFVVAHFVLLPLMDHFTGGAFQDRFQDTSLTDRDMLMTRQMQIWLSHPVLGVGAGVVDSVTSSLPYRAHTEYTRLFAEHGVFGFAALILLLACVYRAFRQARTPHAKAFCLAMALFGLLFMVVSATRLAVLALALGFASVRLIPECRPARNIAPRRSRAPQPGPRLPAGLRRQRADV